MSPPRPRAISIMAGLKSVATTCAPSSVSRRANSPLPQASSRMRSPRAGWRMSSTAGAMYSRCQVSPAAIFSSQYEAIAFHPSRTSSFVGPELMVERYRFGSRFGTELRRWAVWGRPTALGMSGIGDDGARRGVGAGGIAEVVDHVIDRPVVRDRQSQDVVQPDAGRHGHLEGVARVDRGIHVEEAVTAQAPRLVRPDGVGDLVGRVSQGAVRLPPGGLARRVVGHLVLEHDRLAVLAVPDDLVLLVVLDEEAGGDHVIAVDDQARVGGVAGPADAAAVVGPPGPDVVEDDVICVDLQAHGGPAEVGTADPEEHVVKRGRVVPVAPGRAVARLTAWRLPCPDLEQDRRPHRAGVEEEP